MRPCVAVIISVLELGSRRLINNHCCMWMQLQCRGWTKRADAAFHCVRNRIRLAFAKREQHQMASLEDCANALCDAMRWHCVHIVTEEACVVDSRLLSECLNSSTRSER